MILPMYQAPVNSPITTLISDVSPTDTVIMIKDPSKLPPAPNLFTLGDTENAETVKYTQVVGNAFTCERGFQGTPQNWSATEIVSRVFTAYDHNTFINNIMSSLNKVRTVLYDSCLIAEDIYIVLCDSNTKSFSVTLPDASVVNHSIQFKKIDTTKNTVTLIGAIDDKDSYVLELPYEFVELVSDGVKWYVMSE